MSDLLEKYLVHLVKNEEFYAYLSRSVNKIPTDKVPTAGVYAKDGEYHMLWSPKFLSELTALQAIELLKHEFLHIVFGHCTTRIKTKDGKPDKIWFLCCDLAINSLLDINNLPEGGFVPGHFRSLTDREKEHMDPERIATYEEFANFMRGLPKFKSANWYYEEFEKNPKAREMAEEMCQGNGDGGFDVHEQWGDMSESEREAMERQAQAMLDGAIKEAERDGWASIPHQARLLMESMGKTSLSWQDMLRNFIGSTRSTERCRTYRRMNKRYPDILPGIRRRRRSKIAVAIDMSGSMSDSHIARLFEELKNLSHLCEFIVVPFDGEVAEPFVWHVGEDVHPERVKFGMTSFSAPTKWANEHAGEIDGLVIMTDGYASKPIDCHVRRSWVIIPGGRLFFGTEEIVMSLR